MREWARVGREQLYREMWAGSVEAVATRYGTTDSILEATCRRHEIPTPASCGYARGASASEAAPLPTAVDPGLEIVTIFPAPRFAYGDAIEYVRERTPAWKIEVSDDQAVTHPLVRDARAALESAKGVKHLADLSARERRYQRMLEWGGPDALDITVSKRLIPRALRVMNTLALAFEARGFALGIQKGKTVVHALGEEVAMSLGETFRQVIVSDPWRDHQDLEPSGRLKLSLGNAIEHAGVEDTPAALIESQLNRFVAALVRRALKARYTRAMREEGERLWKIYDERERRRLQDRLSEDLRRHRLKKLAMQWRRHQRVADFVADAERRVRSMPLGDEATELARWVEWAKGTLQTPRPFEDVRRQPWPEAALPGPSPMPWEWGRY